MPAELTLRFTSESEVNIIYDGTESGQLPFASPVTDKDRSEIRWYVETYGAQSLADPDDREAKRIEGRLPEIAGRFPGPRAAEKPFRSAKRNSCTCCLSAAVPTTPASSTRGPTRRACWMP